VKQTHKQSGSIRVASDVLEIRTLESSTLEMIDEKYKCATNALSNKDYYDATYLLE